MRLASRALRYVKPKQSILPPQVPPSLLYSQPCASDIRCRTLLDRHGIRLLSLSSAPGPTVDSHLLLAELSNTSDALVKTDVASYKPANDSLIQETKAFHKWSTLLTNPARLAVETDFFRKGPAKGWHGRLLVDKFENHGDLALWACLLDYQMRVNGPAGVTHVWRGLWGRKSLYDVDSPLAPMFWRVMLEGALASNDHSVLESVWIYSEWMYDLHRVKWPQLYNTIITYLLRTHQYRRVLQWQLRLTPNFYPGPDDFAKIIQQFATDKELYRFDTLRSLYLLNPDHSLYNTVIPYLFGLGESQLANKWRHICTRHNDVPLVPTAVRPFLRFTKGYFPNEHLVPEEIAAVDFVFESVEDDRSRLSREFINRVHGRTFGITVKNYNDRLGAKWFASSWVNLDTAMSTISALGIEKIGPLSLQSIALRAESSEDVLSRIAQLQEHGISVVDSNYLHMVVYLATIKDNELLFDLLESDLHPDIFDDFDLQMRLINSTTDVLDYRTLRLLLVARIVTSERSARAVANSVVHACFQRRDQEGLLRILEDMKARNVSINHKEANTIFDGLIVEDTSGRQHLSSQRARFYLSVFRQLASMDVPVPLRNWRIILLIMVRRGRLDDLQRLCVDLVDLFTKSPSSRPGFVPVHVMDLPETMKRPLVGVENLLGVYIPQDLSTRNPLHPLRQLFNRKLLTEMVEHSFHAYPGKVIPNIYSVQLRRHRSQASQISALIRLLRLMREKGMWFRPTMLARMIKLSLITLYGPVTPTKSPQRPMRASNTLTLREMKVLIDEAWGEELLPSVKELQAYIYNRARCGGTKNKVRTTERNNT
ncbi:hypothetical protein F5Y19DRAFT_477291 [Xylariaceae sp. FL1651]|nr:hypothetical protein F5Y19DRAFT_477291 [Xylariaceae sp. FL1651]